MDLREEFFSRVFLGKSSHVQEFLAQGCVKRATPPDIRRGDLWQVNMRTETGWNVSMCPGMSRLGRTSRRQVLGHARLGRPGARLDRTFKKKRTQTNPTKM